jgi:TatD DNase family protein
MTLAGGFDAHTHLDFPAFDAERDAVVERARAAGVATWVIAGSDSDRWDDTVRIAEDTGGIPILGVHPWTAAELNATEFDPFLADLRRRDVPGIGEIGLDALHARTPVARERQRQALRSQLALARERNLPIALHCVRAYPELIVLLERDGIPGGGGMVHAWSGPPELMPRFLALGLHISFAPLVLRERARKARSSIPLVPDDRLLIETDCPNMFPLGADRGEPAHLVDVARGVATLRGQPLEHVWAVTAQNGRRLFSPA